MSKKKTFSLASFKDRKLHLALGWLLIIVSIFLFISFLSFIQTGESDFDIIDARLSQTDPQHTDVIQNWAGFLGALISYLFILKGFGFFTILIPPILFLYGVKIIWDKELLPLLKATLFALFYNLWLSNVFGYAILGDNHNFMGTFTGEWGYKMAESIDNFIGWGAILIYFFTLIVFNMFFFRITNFPFYNQEIKNGIKKINELWEKIEAKTQFKKKPHVSKEQIERLKEEFEKEEQEKQEELENNENQSQELTVPQNSNENKKMPPHQEHNGISIEIENPKSDDSHEVSQPTVNYDPTLELPRYQYPTFQLLKNYPKNEVKVTKDELEENKDKIVETLINFKIGIENIKATIGPTVTLYEIIPKAGIKISKIKNLENDIALSLAALGIRIIAPIPGKGTIGIEVPNKNRKMVDVKSVITTAKFSNSSAALPIVLGKTISNEVLVTDLTKMPHLLMAGATGQGKSVGLNLILTSLLYKKHPSQLKLVLVDPKKVELALYNQLEKHFLAKLPNNEEAIITDTSQVVDTLNSLCIEMDERYELLKSAGCRNISEYNQKFIDRKLNPLKGHKFLPYIVLVIDELADLMMTAGKEVELPIARLAQLARAIGIHLILATQRPSVNVITGTIKANFPARLSFRVTSKVDSRTILDMGGADQLIGMGDMLLAMDSEVIRLQCAFVDTQEIVRICDFIANQKGYDSAYLLPEFVRNDNENTPSGQVDISDKDNLFKEAARIIVMHQQGSTSLLQRKLKIGYNRAGRLIDQLEVAGIVGPFEGSKAREVFIQDEMALEQVFNDME